jgi:hypothetical protein
MPWSQVLGSKEKNPMPDARDCLLQAAELLELTELLICILETSNRGVVVRFAVTELKALREAVALLNVSMP